MGARRPPRRSRRRATVSPARFYSRDYPCTGGHSYPVRSIPTAIWRLAAARAKAEGRSIRHVIIHLLEEYGREDEARDTAADGRALGTAPIHP